MPENLIDDTTFAFVEGARKSELTSVKGRMTTAEGKITTLEGTVSGYGTRLDDDENTISNQGTRLTTAEGTISSHETRVTTLEGKIKNITISTSDPSGGEDGDIWIKVTS